MQKRLSLWIVLLLVFQLAEAQDRRVQSRSVNRDSITAMRGAKSLLDTEEKKGYGPQSTRFTYEENFKYNDIVFSSPDTLPENTHRFNDLASEDFLIQNMGNIGSAVRKLIWDPSIKTGVNSGYNAFNSFYTTPDQIKYFDTRSPYTELNADFGSGGRAKTSVLFSLNDSINFNFGFAYNNIRTDKQLAYLQRGDFNVKSTDWNFFGFLRPKKLPKYLLLFNMTQFRHEVDEQGGILDPAINPNDTTDIWDYRDENVILSEATALEKRGGGHIYQQYDIDSIFQVYHAATYEQQLNRYYDIYDLGGSDSLMYTSGLSGLERDTIDERTTYQMVENEVGLKGRTKRFSYTVNFKNRWIRNEIVRTGEKLEEVENYVGGTLRQQITPKIFLKASGELGLQGNYSVSGNFASSFFVAEYKRISRRPTFLERRYISQQQEWSNDFSNETSDNFYGELRLPVGKLLVQPFTRFNVISNYIFFNEQKVPEQTGSEVVILTPGLNLRWQVGPRVTLKNATYYTSVSGGSAEKYPAPKWLNTTQIAYRNTLFSGKMMIQTGIDVHYRSSYFAPTYNPVNQQYHLQTDEKLDGFIHADLFFNFKVKSFRFFAKIAHINQGAPLGSDGYFITPLYPGTRRTFDMGVIWQFFD